MFDARSILDFPWFYKLLQSLTRTKKHTKEYVDTYVKPKEGDVILDIGCGPADILEFLPKVKYYGFDLNSKYINEAKRKYGACGTFFCEEMAESSAPKGIEFDLVLANRVLHHLNDGEAIRLFKLAKNHLKSGGRLVTIDGCRLKGESFISKILSSLDRGKYIRDNGGYLNLARKIFNNVEHHIRGDLSNIPGSHIVICCAKE